ncbi:hypothetical protein U91I_02413 [alpha proteobacterium U9-1i]|nr:hypothetical protein U91I_02413 [alpha proteobacterium U9-1i]
MVFGATAAAEPWSDPSGRLSFSRPDGWTVNQEFGDSATDAYTYVITGDAANECHVMAQPNPGTAAATADAVRRANGDTARFTPELWTQIANGVANIFPNRSASVLSNTAEGTQWPIQRAEIQSSQRLVFSSMQLRPGTDILVFCMNYEGAPRADLFDGLIRSVGHPNDAVYFADAAQAESERVAAAAAQAEAEAIAQGVQEAQERPTQAQSAADAQSRRDRAAELRRRLRGR